MSQRHEAAVAAATAQARRPSQQAHAPPGTTTCELRARFWSAAPQGSTGPTPIRKSISHAQRQRHLVEVGLADGDLLVEQGLGDQRVHRAQQHHEGERREDEVVEQDAALARDDRVSRWLSATSRWPRTASSAIAEDQQARR